MKKMAIMVVFVSVLSLNSQAIGAVTLPFTDGFESYNAGTNPPPPWTTLTEAPGIVTTAKAHGGMKSLVVTGGPIAPQNSVVDLGTNYTDLLQYDGWVNNDGGGAVIGFHEQLSGQTLSFNAVVFKANREVWFSSADEVTGFNVPLASGLSSGWHYVKVQLNFQTLQGDIWLDGALVGNQLPISPKNEIYEGSSAVLSHIGILHAEDSPVYLDDFSIVCANPAPFALTYPAYGGTGIPITIPLVWSSSLNADSYDVYLGTSPDPPYVGNTNNASYLLSGLSYLTTYYWKIVARNNCGASTPGTVWYFTTGCPEVGIPSNPSPATGAAGISNGPTLTWSSVSNADSYDVYLGTSANPPYLGNTASTSYSLSGLNYGTLYYWKIIGKNSCGSSTPGPVWNFSTVSCSYTLSPLTQSFDGSGGSASVSVATVPVCCWSASTNPGSWDWIGISSGTTGCGNGIVNYYVMPNGTGASRAGTLAVAGQSFTVNQSPVCAYAIFPTGNSFGSGGGQGSFTVTAGPDCFWTASASPGSWDWIGISSGSSGTGNGTVNYFVLPNNTGSARTGTLSIAGQTFTVTQQPGACSYAISPSSSMVGRDAGSGSVNVITSNGCPWSASTNPGSWDWIAISSGSSGTGNGTVNYVVLANNTASTRTGTLTIAGRTFTITQYPACAYSLLPASNSFGAGAGSGSVNVTTSPICSWTASASPGSWDWIGISSGSSGTGNGTVNYFVLPNSATTARTGTLTIAGQAFIITQSEGCSYAILPTGAILNRDGGSGSVNVITSSGCLWSASANPGSWGWIGISSGSNGIGSGTVSYFALANTGNDRTGTLTIAGKTFTLVQSGTAGTNPSPWLVDEDFDKYLSNQPPPSPWSSLNPAGFPGIVSDQAAHSGEKSLVLSGESEEAKSAVVDIGDSYGHNLSIEVLMKIDSPSSGGYVGFFEEMDNQTLEFNCVYFNGRDGTIYFTSSDRNHPINVVLAQEFEMGVWNKVRVDLNFETLTATVHVNDALVGDSIPISPRDAAWGSSQFRLRKIGMLRSPGDDVSFDDFSVRKE